VKKLEFDVLKPYLYRSIENSQFHRAVAISRAGSVLTGRFESLYEQNYGSGISAEESERPENGKWRELLLPVWRDWLAFVQRAPAAQRAAALLAADSVLDAAQDAGQVPGWPGKSEKRSELQELGASFEMNGIAGYHFDKNNFRDEARQLDPNGPLGRMALITSMACGSGDVGMGIGLVSQGNPEWRGAVSKDLDASTMAQVHFMVGDAYATNFAIAKGIDPNGDYGSSVQESDAEPARAKALEHYRAGLTTDNTSENT